MQQLPEPLQSFRAVERLVSLEIQALETAFARYRSLRQEGRILPNSIEAMRVELTYHSNAIEGNTLSLRDTQLVLEGVTPPGGKTLREVDEARNHDRALRMVEQWASERPPSTAPTERDLLDIHAVVLADILDIHAVVLADIDPASSGRFRSDRVLIKGTGFVPPGSHKFADLIPKMLALAAADGIHPALQAAELHYNLVAIRRKRPHRPATDKLSPAPAWLLARHLRGRRSCRILQRARRGECRSL